MYDKQKRIHKYVLFNKQDSTTVRNKDQMLLCIVVHLKVRQKWLAQLALSDWLTRVNNIAP